jgi:hypothetical protein
MLVDFGVCMNGGDDLDWGNSTLLKKTSPLAAEIIVKLGASE